MCRSLDSVKSTHHKEQEEESESPTQIYQIILHPQLSVLLIVLYSLPNLPTLLYSPSLKKKNLSSCQEFII